MKILFVVDQFKSGGNGTTISAERFVSCLRNLGHQVRVVTTGHSCEDLYIVPERYVFLATEFARKQGLLFAKPDKKVLTEAIEWCDIVHFVMPFAISKRGVKIAKKLKKPYTAAFHVQAENITYNIGLGRSKLARNIVYYFLKRKFYRRVENIHCPSEFIANELRKHKYKGNLHVISNGVNSVFKPKKCEKPDEIKDKIIITMVGRHSAEKRQDLLIKAVDYSKYKDNIQLVFAGKGPKTKYYENMGQHLKNKPVFTFFNQERLVKLLQYSDLYVHTADVEIEAISCLEALATGLVPIISDSPQSATKQFALTLDSLFESDNIKDLANKIDYWIEHKEEKEEYSKKYAKFAEEFNLEKSVKKFEEMLECAIMQHQNQI